MKAEMKKTWFTIDGLEDNSYQGYTDGQTWNGWQCPLFELNVALKLADDLNQVNTVNGQLFSKIVFDEKSQQFVNEDYDCPKEEWETFAATEHDGKKLFALGSYAWCWELAFPETTPELCETKTATKKKM